MMRSCISFGGDSVVDSTTKRATNYISWSTLEKLKYAAARKLSLRYEYMHNIVHNECNKWSIVMQTSAVATVLDGDIETSIIAYPGDFVLSGSKGENYVVRFEKMAQLYERAADDAKVMVVIPQTRMAACYMGDDGVFEPTWGGQMVLKKGDYVIREGANKYYRIGQGVFKETYEFCKK